MSSLVCNTTHCTFTRIDTDGYALGPPPIYTYPPIFTGAPGSNATDFPSAAPTPLNSTNTTIAPWTDPENQDMLSDTVALTRDYRGGLFNALAPDDQYLYYAPSNTEWAFLPEGKTFEESRCSLYFCSWYDCFSGYYPEYAIGKPGIVHLIEEDVYYNIMLTNWTTDCYDGYCSPPPCYDDYCPQTGVLDSVTRAPGVRRRMKGDTRHRRGREAEENITTISYPVPPYPYPYPNTGPGGGFQYVRDAEPFALSPDLPECPRCELAVADPAVLLGRINNEYVNVSITGVTPLNGTEIFIKAVSQESHPKCNSAPPGSVPVPGRTRRNAVINDGNSTVALRRTLVPGELNAFRYTVYFDATSEGGTCSGQVSVCVPVPGFGCDDYVGSYDATATRYCVS